MDPVDDPFRAADAVLEQIAGKAKIVIVDMHAEATSEKGGIAWYLDGRVSAVVGTHTHIQTADEHILPKGTGFITDVGMTGPYDSVLGLEPKLVISKFTSVVPERFEIASGRAVFCAVLLDVDPRTGLCTKIERIQRLVESTGEGVGNS
jgi:metallophosphoesterase (TIGR00282 family)